MCIRDIATTTRTATRLGVDGDVAVPLGERGTFDATVDAQGRVVHGLDGEGGVALAATTGARRDVADRGQLGLDLSTRDRFEPSQRCDDDDLCTAGQAYRAASATAHGGYRAPWGGAGASATWTRFVFVADDDQNRHSPGAAAWISWNATDRLRLGASYDVAQHRYRAFDMQIGTNGGLYVDDTARRRDVGQSWSATARYHAPTLRMQLRYAYQRNNSSSAARSYDRHVVEPTLTTVPFGDLLVRLSGRVVQARYDVRRTIEQALNVDDDARSRATIVLEHPLKGVLAAEAGYSYFTAAQTLAGSDDATARYTFQRHLAHVALSVRWERPD